jgi:hypothetical protein
MVDVATSASPLRFERPSAVLADSFAERLRGWCEGRDLPEGWAPIDVFWIVEGEVVVGQCDVRCR